MRLPPRPQGEIHPKERVASHFAHMTKFLTYGANECPIQWKEWLPASCPLVRSITTLASLQANDFRPFLKHLYLYYLTASPQPANLPKLRE